MCARKRSTKPEKIDANQQVIDWSAQSQTVGGSALDTVGVDTTKALDPSISAKAIAVEDTSPAAVTGNKSKGRTKRCRKQKGKVAPSTSRVQKYREAKEAAGDVDVGFWLEKEIVDGLMRDVGLTGTSVHERCKAVVQEVVLRRRERDGDEEGMK